jgi:hypothetical protein
MTGVMSERAEEYRRLAADCLTMARTTSNEQTRIALIDQAQTWLRLAEEQEASQPPPATPDRPQPVAQQQQQVQPKKDEDAAC